MFACACGKTSYPSAGAAYHALAAQQGRVKRSRKSRSRLTRHATQIDQVHVKAYRCMHGAWHIGHDSMH